MRSGTRMQGSSHRRESCWLNSLSKNLAFTSTPCRRPLLEKLIYLPKTSPRLSSSPAALLRTSFDKYHYKLEREIGPEYDMAFEDLLDEHKIEVYDEILKSSGRGTYLKNTFYKVADKVGKGLLLFTLAMSVWDVYSSEHKIQTAVSEVAEFGAGYMGGNLGEAGGAAVVTYLVTAVGVAETAATAAFVGLAAFATGFGVGIALGFLAGYVVKKIFESGGKDTGGVLQVKKGSDDKHTKPRPVAPALPTHHFQVYVAPMPDGARLARQVAYKGAPTIANTPSSVAVLA